jgi:hypothetical protein
MHKMHKKNTSWKRLLEDYHQRYVIYI